MTMNDVTRILSAIEESDTKAAYQLLPLVYDELRKLAPPRYHTMTGHRLVWPCRATAPSTSGPRIRRPRFLLAVPCHARAVIAGEA
jgi:hypothetical protein